MTQAASTIDDAEVAKFDAMAADWWRPDGQFKPLHEMSPVRLDFLREQCCAQFGRAPGPRALAGLRAVDLGCGGGLLAEPMARLGADVTAIDPSPEAIGAARAHAALVGLDIGYRQAAAEDLAAEGLQFDLAASFEVIEHVADPAAYLRAAAALLRPGGLFLATTLNRTPESLALAVIGAEYVLRWLPRGTHEWRKFLTPEEFKAQLREAGLEPVDETGFVYNPITGHWRRSPRNLRMNYALAAVKPG